MMHLILAAILALPGVVLPTPKKPPPITVEPQHPDQDQPTIQIKPKPKKDPK